MIPFGPGRDRIEPIRLQPPLRHDLPMDLAGEVVDLLRELSVEFEFLLGFGEVMVRLRLLDEMPASP